MKDKIFWSILQVLPLIVNTSFMVVARNSHDPFALNYSIGVAILGQIFAMSIMLIWYKR
jgi:hypothetical protein